MKRRAEQNLMPWLAFLGGDPDYTWVVAEVKVTFSLNN